MPLLSKLPVELFLTSEDLSPFSPEYVDTNSGLVKTFKFLVDLLHNQYDVKKLSVEDKTLLGRRKLYPELDAIFQYEETYSWLLALTRSFYVKNSISRINSSSTQGKKLAPHINRYYYLINKYPPKVLERHTDSPEHTYSLISSLV
jgi:hypothetical protein